MNLELSISPFNSHDNILFGFIKKYLVDSNIYDISNFAFPYTRMNKKYQFTLLDCFDNVSIYHNDILFSTFNGHHLDRDENYTFYILPKFGKNEIKVIDDNGNLKIAYQFNCYNIHVFLAMFSSLYKDIWNKLQQAHANTYYNENIIQDLDGTYLKPEDRFTRAVAKLLGTERYSLMNDTQYYTYLHNIFDIHLNAGTYDGFYRIQQALSDYIERIDSIPIEDYIPFKNELYGKVFYDATDNKKIKIYPTYHRNNLEWQMVNFYNDSLDDDLNAFAVYVYIDDELETTGNNTGSVKIKFTNDPEFYKSEYQYEDIFFTNDILNDEDGFYTGFKDGKYIVLRRPMVNKNISVDSTGSVDVSESFYLSDDYNLVVLGTRYQNEIDSVKVQYQTFQIPRILAKLDMDSTSPKLIKKIFLSGQADTDAAYLSYKENDHGSVVITVRVKEGKIVKEELKRIVNRLIRDVLPLHIKYYIVFSTIGVWDWWGQDDFTFGKYFGDGTNEGTFSEIQIQDLK